jgi:hypothetical protein
MVNKDQPNLSAGAFWQKMVLPEEDRRNQLSAGMERQLPLVPVA